MYSMCSLWGVHWQMLLHCKHFRRLGACSLQRPTSPIPGRAWRSRSAHRQPTTSRVRHQRVEASETSPTNVTGGTASGNPLHHPDLLPRIWPAVFPARRQYLWVNSTPLRTESGTHSTCALNASIARSDFFFGFGTLTLVPVSVDEEVHEWTFLTTC